MGINLRLFLVVMVFNRTQWLSLHPFRSPPRYRGNPFGRALPFPGRGSEAPTRHRAPTSSQALPYRSIYSPLGAGGGGGRRFNSFPPQEAKDKNCHNDQCQSRQRQHGDITARFKESRRKPTGKAQDEHLWRCVQLQGADPLLGLGEELGFE